MTTRCTRSEFAGLWFGPRRDLEEMDEYRQLVPYILLQIGFQFIRYMRAPAGSEARLHGRMSIGFGGHIELADAVVRGSQIDVLATIERAAEREVLEELGQIACKDQRWIGLLVDNTTVVGRVHLGLVGIRRLSVLPDLVRPRKLSARSRRNRFLIWRPTPGSLSHGPRCCSPR